MVHSLKVDSHALALRVAVEHALERVLAADAALLVATVRLAWKLSQPLIDLHPTRLDRMRCTQSLGEIVRPHVCGEPVMAVIGHTHSLRFVFPWDRDEHWSEDLLAGEAPLVAHPGEDRRFHK